MDQVNNDPNKTSATAHDSRAFVQAAVERHQAPLLRYAARLLGGDVEAARDVVQDTFARLVAQPPGEVDGHLAEWLFTVCRHRVFDVLRKEGRMRRFAEGEAERLTLPEPPPAQRLEKAEARAAMLESIGRLPPNQQEVIRLKFQSGFSYKEISRITSLSVGNVGFLIHTAVQRLRRELAAQGE
jgi:RNA polymerase sigma-70 factor (ECF subfamily)